MNVSKAEKRNRTERVKNTQNETEWTEMDWDRMDCWKSGKLLTDITETGDKCMLDNKKGEFVLTIFKMPVENPVYTSIVRETQNWTSKEMMIE